MTNWAFQARLNLMTGRIALNGNNLEDFITEFYTALHESPDKDGLTAQVLFLKGLEKNPYLLYSVLHGWTEGTLDDMVQKACTVLTGVVHPMMMAGMSKVPMGSSPMNWMQFVLSCKV